MLLLPHFRDGETESQHIWDLNSQERSQTEPVSLWTTLYYRSSNAFSSFCLRVQLFLTARSLVKAAQPFPAGKKCGATFPLGRSASLQLQNSKTTPLPPRDSDLISIY